MDTAIRNMTMEDVFELDDIALQKYISRDFKESGRKFVQTDDFLYYCGTFPVLLVAHMDTVHTHLPTICKSSSGDIWMAPEGIGGDDRCGIWIILNILEHFDCQVLFTQGEEIGGIGAKAFAASGLIPSVNYIIEIDRQGDDDAVFYSCGNKAFKDFIVNETGFVESFGSFSDISILSPKFDLASVNLSSGYYSPHSHSEFIKLSDMNATMMAVEYALSMTDVNKEFKYERTKYSSETFDMAAYQKAYGYGYYGNGNSFKSARTSAAAWVQEDDDDDDDEYPPFASSKFTKLEKQTDTTTVIIPAQTVKAKAEKTSFLSPDDETYQELERQDKEDTFEQLLFDETEMFLKAVTGYVPDEDTTLRVAIAVEDILIDAAYLPTLY